MKKAVLFTAGIIGLISLISQLSAQSTPQFFAGTGHWYQVVTSPNVTWTQAKAAATAAGGYLACINSQAENNFVLGLTPPPPATWIGGSDQVTEGNWQWVSGEAWSFTNWGSDEPSSGGGLVDEDYLEMWTAIGHPTLDPGDWNDDATSQPSYVIEFNENQIAEIVPIVLVHGWTSTSGIWGDLTNRLKADGFGPVWPVQLVPCGTEEERLFDPGNPATVKYLFRGNASELSSQIRQRFNSMAADSQARVQEIDIIAHSMGGLVARRYIQSYFSDDDWRGERFRVRNLIMLGTPNKGSSFGGWWTASNLFGGCHWGDPAYGEIGEEYMKIFNAWFPDKVSETSYHAAAGSGGVGEAIITDCGAVYGCYNGAGVFLNDCDFGGNDGLVTVRSARTSPTGFYYPGVVRFLCHNQYYTDASLYTSFIKKVISGQPYSNESEREGTEAPRIASICFQHTDSLVNAISKSGNFLIDANDVAYIYASANYVEFEFRITSPASQIYDSLSTTIDSSVIALTGEDGICGFVIQNAEAGQWQWELVLPSIPIAPVYFGILASTHSSVSATASQNLDYLVLGDSLVLNISVLDGAFPLTNLNIYSIPTYNNIDTLAPLQFTDDGLHSDGAANDGDYGLVISNLQDGIISLRSTIEGNASGGPVKRILSQSAYIQSFSCGDADVNGIISISDAVFLINYIFSGGLAPNPIQAGDADCNSIVTISDAVYLINYIFGGGAAPCAACP